MIHELNFHSKYTQNTIVIKCYPYIKVLSYTPGVSEGLLGGQVGC